MQVLYAVEVLSLYCIEKPSYPLIIRLQPLFDGLIDKQTHGHHCYLAKYSNGVDYDNDEDHVMTTDIHDQKRQRLLRIGIAGLSFRSDTSLYLFTPPTPKQPEVFAVSESESRGKELKAQEPGRRHTLEDAGVTPRQCSLQSRRVEEEVTTWEEEESKGAVPVVEFVWEAANIAFSLVSLVVTFISIARFIAEVLTPLSTLFGCILNLVLSSVVLALDVVIYVQRRDKQYSIIGLGLDAALIFFTIIPLIYAIIIYRRLLNYDDYHLPGNHKAFGFASPEEGIEDRSSLYLSPPTAYDPTNPTLGITTTITSGEAQTRGRSVSIGSHRISLSFSRNASVSPHPSPPLDAEQERRTSYDHKRDTQFEDYLARRASQKSGLHRRDSYYEGTSLQNDVKRALGDEFGFGDLPSPAEPSKTNARGEVV
ncbi:hypothetical protein CHU98_g10295, partial [Xylaria longipes]